ncbi:hypothetical protein ACP4OV_030707 [Aristida adscensionis]
MDTFRRKRHLSLQNQETLPADAKKVKNNSSTSESIEILIHVLRNLTEQQITVVQDIGFSSLLGLSCSHIPIELFNWLVKYFDVCTKTLNLPNGFKFTLNASCVHKILGIPNGPKPILSKGTLESYLFIKERFNSKGPTPSVHELFSIITPELLGSDFAWAFMLLVLSSFLCPNTRGVYSCKYYPAIIFVTSIRDLDWSSLVLDWLMLYIKKYKEGEEEICADEIGGCALILVICYLEFLSSPEFNFRIQSPRLKLWSSTNVQALTYLDSIPGSTPNFGRLHLKHICLTPFNDCYVSETACTKLREDVQNFIKENLSTSSQENVTELFSNFYSKLKQSVISENLPAVCSIMHNIIRFLCVEACEKFNGHKTTETYLEDTDSDSDDLQDVIARKIPCKCSKGKKNIPKETIVYLLKYWPLLPMPELDIVDTCSDLFLLLLESIEQKTQEDHVSLQFRIPTTSFEELFSESITNNNEVTKTSNLRLLNVDIKSLAMSESKVSLDNVKYLKDLVPERHVATEDINSLILKIENRASENEESSTTRRKNCGLSLNERVTGYRKPQGTTENADFRNFDILGDLDKEEEEQVPAVNSARTANASSDQNDSVIRSLHRSFRKCSEMLYEEAEGPATQEADVQPNQESYVLHNHPPTGLKQPSVHSRAIFASDAEIRFHHMFTTNIDRSTRRCWIHYNVMDSFCMMLSACQQEIENVPGRIARQYFVYSVAKILMNTTLDHKCYKINFLETVGFKIDGAQLV